MTEVKNKTQWCCRSFKNTKYESGTKYLKPVKVVSILFGIVPLVRKGKNRSRVTVSSEIAQKQKTGFKISFTTLLLWIAHFIINMITFVRKYKFEMNKIGLSVGHCFEQNYCFRTVLFFLRSIRPSFALIIIIMNAQKVLQFLERLNAVLKKQMFRVDFQNALGKYLLYFFFVPYSILNWYYAGLKLWQHQVIYYLNTMLPFTLDFFIITILNVIKKCFQNINVEIRQLTKTFEKEKLGALMILHWELNDLIAEADLCYGMNILVSLICTVIETILFLFYFLEANTRMDAVKRNLLQDVFLLFRIVLLCKKGTDVVLQSNESLVQLERLSRKKARLLNGSGQTAIEVFRGRLKNRKSMISCGGFVNINLDFITTMVGFVLMYWVVLIQFNDENEKKQKPNETKN